MKKSIPLISEMDDEFELTFVERTITAHKCRHFFDAFEWEWRLREWAHGNGHKFHWVVVSGDAVGTETAAATTAMDNGPFSVLAYPNADSVHDAAAVGSTVARFVVEVQTRKAVWAMIAVLRGGTAGDDRASAYFAGKTVVARVGLVIMFIVFFAFILSIH